MQVQRVTVQPADSTVNANIVARFPLDRAAWVWHPDARDDRPIVLKFVNRFTLDKPITSRIHISADQRYQFFIDGQRIGMGPDRSELWSWSFASYELTLDAGKHTVEALAWWLGELKPVAQVTWRGGFIFTAEQLENQLATGRGPWRVAEAPGHSFTPGGMAGYHVIGPAQTFDSAAARAAEPMLVEPRIVRPPLDTEPRTNHTGVVAPGWRLEPSDLPDMMHQPRRTGRVRAVIDGDGDRPVTDSACRSDDMDTWRQLIDSGEPVTVAPNRAVHVIVDLEDYYCGFGDVELTGGAGGGVRLEWAESLFEVRHGKRSAHKANRGDVAGKLWFGFGDEVIGNGDRVRFTGLWWRSGRYLRLSVQTAEQPLTLHRVGFVETRYPCENDGHWQSDRPELDAIVPPAVRGIQMCAHETYTDCPYYEQMMYVGDTRLQMLTAYVMTRDDRLTRRGIELFDRSRWLTGFVAERCPSQPFQVSLTFSMIWVLMVRDYLMWRGDRAWVRARLTGIRAQFEGFLPMLNNDGLLEDVPGWSFVDWAEPWRIGWPPDATHGVSSVVNLLFVCALKSAAAVEAECGEAAMAERYAVLAERTGTSVVERFWDKQRERMADDVAHEHFSEHAQSLAIVTGVLDDARQAAVLRCLQRDDDLVRTTVYFSFYLLEAMSQLRRGDLVVKRLRFWDKLSELDLKTPFEQPEPSRSDCHAWGSHPLFHFHATLAGVRPSSPAFESVLIQPAPGPLRRIDSDIPHPRGRLRTSLQFDGDQRCRAQIQLPPDTPGTLVWNGISYHLNRGTTNTIET